MDHWRIAYLGIRQVPRELSEFELSTFFTFSRRELASIDSRRSDLYRLAMALHVGFIRMTGRTLDSYKQIPPVLLRHLGQQLGVQSLDVGTLRSIYDGNLKTLSDHQIFAQTIINFRSIAEHQRRYVIRWLKEQLTGRPERSQLMSDLKRWFYEHRIVIPPDRMLRKFIVQAVHDVEASLHETLQQALGTDKLDSWARLLAQPHADHISLQRWLWAVPLRGSTHQMSEVLDKINLLTMHGVAENWPVDCNDAIVRHYARRCASRPPSISKRIEPHGRRLEAACFVRYALCTATDQVLAMLRRWVQKVVNDASREVDAARVKAANQLHEFAAAVKALATDESLSHEDLRKELCVLAGHVLHPSAPNRRSQIRQCLILKRHHARNMLMRIVQLPFGAETTHPVLDAIVLLRGLYRCHAYLLPDGVNIRLVRAWREAIDGYDRLKAMVAFEWATLFSLRVALRNGSVFIAHSFSFRSQTHMLIPAEEWPIKRNNLYGHLGLPQDPMEFLGPILTHLDQRLELLGQAVDEGKVRIDTAVHLDPLDAQPGDAEADRLRRAIFEAHPPGQLPEIILEIDSATRFNWILLGREPRSRTELLIVYSAILAHGTSLSAADISRMVPEVSPPAIRQMMKRLEDERMLRLAADVVLEFMHEHPVAAHWGRADLASSDMMSLETTRTVWQARADPRRRTASIGMYTHVLDRWGIFYDQPIVLNERQAGAAIEGVVRQTTTDIAALAVDTHGYTDFAMGMARALGFDLCPRLSHLRDRRLHLPRRHDVPLRLVPITDRDVSLDLIADVWDEFVRIAASIRSGKCTAVDALTRFGSAARGQAVYEGGVHIGRLFRSIFLIDYFTNTAFRTELQHVLNRGGAVHNVQRAIHIGKIPVELARRQESLSAVSSALTLLANILMAWNTTHMQRVLGEIQAATGQPLESEQLRRIAPTHLEGINLRGTFNFPVARYARRILPSLASDLHTSTASRRA